MKLGPQTHLGDKHTNTAKNGDKDCMAQKMNVGRSTRGNLVQAVNPALVVIFAIWGMPFANCQGIVACLPFPVKFPLPSILSKFLFWMEWGGEIFPAKMALSTTTVVRGGRGGVLHR